MSPYFKYFFVRKLIISCLILFFDEELLLIIFDGLIISFVLMTFNFLNTNSKEI